MNIRMTVGTVRKGGLVLGAAALLLLGGCASMNLENYQFAGEKVVFESDFTEMPESARGWEDNGQVIHEEEKGAVHLRVEEGDGPIATTSFSVEEPVTRSSRVSFRIKLGEEINSRHPLSHINLLASQESWVCLMFDDEWGVGYFWHGGGSRGDGHVTETNLEQDRWYQVDILLKGNTGVLFLDKKRKGSFRVSSKLPGWGSLDFGCHNEYWVDDVKITHFDAYTVEKEEE